MVTNLMVLRLIALTLTLALENDADDDIEPQERVADGACRVITPVETGGGGGSIVYSDSDPPVPPVPPFEPPDPNSSWVMVSGA